MSTGCNYRYSPVKSPHQLECDELRSKMEALTEPYMLEFLTLLRGTFEDSITLVIPRMSYGDSLNLQDAWTDLLDIAFDCREVAANANGRIVQVLTGEQGFDIKTHVKAVVESLGEMVELLMEGPVFVDRIRATRAILTIADVVSKLFAARCVKDLCCNVRVEWMARYEHAIEDRQYSP
jgi:hypothetical protein